ncbi:cysteine desulfurase family protein [Sphingobacterium chungjuense]|uniref:cysteine desulfurase family protein n=1 Tax=Sphingobacterium chungjuense TaxID=2675553 RepID=UPI00140E4E8C|nr:cysteine desulfurase family protein [Sphingobacterium chungjuense]
MREKLIYLDHNATTPVDPRVVEAMIPYFSNTYANPSSPHLAALVVQEAVEHAWNILAKSLGCHQDELLLTSGATESINLAMKGIVTTERQQIVVLATEHEAVLNVCLYLEALQKYEITYLPVQPDGRCDLLALEKAISTQTALVCAMLVNNETGVVQDISSIAALAHAQGACLLCDATQGFGKMQTEVDRLGVDFLTISAHKCYGPKGVGALYIRSGTPRIDPQIHGGNQQSGLRSGTLNVPGLIGLAKAAEICLQDMQADTYRITELRDRLEHNLLQIEKTVVNGNILHRLYTTTSISFEGVNALQLIRALGPIAVSNGSACSAATIEPSHVLLEMGLSHEQALSTIRFSLGRFTTKEEIDTAVQKISSVVRQIRMA